MLSSAAPMVRCRQIQHDDLDRITDLLTEGFPDRPRNYWTSGFQRLAQRTAPEGIPQFGYMLESGGAPVGVLLMLFTGSGAPAELAPRINVSSWYVKPAFRSQATLMVAMAMKRKGAVYLNTSPMPHTLPVLNAMGFKPLSRGQFLAAPLLSAGGRSQRVREIGPFSRQDDYPDTDEFELLRSHAAHGCLSLAVGDGQTWSPFVFLRRGIRYSPVGVVQLAYCRDTAEFVCCAGALGRHLAGSGCLLTLCDANGPVPGLVGRYFPGKSPKYFKGPVGPRLNDLAFTEAVVFGP